MRHRRIVVSRYGGPDELRVVEEECPEPKPGEVRVRVLAAGVSLPDVMMREGIHPETPRLPFTPGWDLVGVVERLGDGVSGIEPGQTVAALPIIGAYAELVCLPQAKLVPVPAGLDPAEAVSLVLNYVTAYQMLHRSAKVTRGQRVLIHGAAGGVGTALLQLGRLAGLEMYGTCSSRGASDGLRSGRYPDRLQAPGLRRGDSPAHERRCRRRVRRHRWHATSGVPARLASWREGGGLRAHWLPARGALASGRSGSQPLRSIAIFLLYTAGGWLLPGGSGWFPTASSGSNG
jgi:NADPH2:quinone reductase